MVKLDNGDEQAAAIRRELDGRMQLADSIMRERRFPKFKIDEDKSELEFNKSYIEELRSQVKIFRHIIFILTHIHSG